MRALLVGLGILVAALLGGLAAAPGASAHATIVSSSPGDQSRLQTAPATVSVTFDESVGLAGVGYLKVVDQNGKQVDTGNATHPAGNGTKIQVGLQPGLGDGTYTISFRIISADSHPIAGALRFVVGDGALGATVGSTSNTDPATGVAFDVVRWITFAGLAVLGGGWLMVTVWPAGRDDRSARRLLWGGWITAVVGALAELLVQGPYSAGTGLGQLFKFSLLDATLHTSFGTAHSVRLLLLGAIGAGIGILLRGLRRTRVAEMCGLLMIGVVLTYAVSGHADSENPRWLAIPSDALHLCAMSAWIGGLAYLAIAVLPRRDPDELAEVLPTFSRVAFISVAVMAVTGLYQAYLGVNSLDALTATRYGQLVLVKAGLFIVLLVIGNLSRIAIQRRFVQRPLAFAMTEETEAEADYDEAEYDEAEYDDDQDEADSDWEEPVREPLSPVDEARVSRMRRSVWAELAVAVVVFGVTAVLVSQPPGAAAEASLAAKPAHTSINLGSGRDAAVTINPGKHGSVSVQVVLSGPGPKAQSLTATAGLAAKELGPVAVPLKSTDGKTWTAAGVLLPSAGNWEIDLNLRTSEFDSVTADGTVRLR